MINQRTRITSFTYLSHMKILDNIRKLPVRTLGVFDQIYRRFGNPTESKVASQINKSNI